jgi:hypothetical protein
MLEAGFVAAVAAYWLLVAKVERYRSRIDPRGRWGSATWEPQHRHAEPVSASTEQRENVPGLKSGCRSRFSTTVDKGSPAK